MPVLTNKIDTLFFDDLRGNIPLREQQLETFTRPGIDGVGFRKTGKRSQPTTLRTTHYVADWDAAKDAITAYQALVDTDPVTIIQHSTDWGTFKVMSVKQVEAKAVTSVIGSLVNNPQVLQTCEWTVIQ